MPYDETSIERILDRAVWRRLATDRAYRNAANADEQQAREEEIGREEYARLYQLINQPRNEA